MYQIFGRGRRWAIIQKHPELDWSVKQMDFPDKWAAIAWMCRNQLGRRNLTDACKFKLIQEEHDAMIRSIGGQPGNKNAEKRTGQNDHFVSECGAKTRAINA